MLQAEKQVLEAKLKKNENDLSRQLTYAQQVSLVIGAGIIILILKQLEQVDSGWVHVGAAVLHPKRLSEVEYRSNPQTSPIGF